jgi:hypothetical protein
MREVSITLHEMRETKQQELLWMCFRYPFPVSDSFVGSSGTDNLTAGLTRLIYFSDSRYHKTDPCCSIGIF